MSLMGKLNYYCLQWFGIRLCKQIEEDTAKKITSRGILYFVVPLSGYGGRPYKFIGGQRMFLPKLLASVEYHDN